tara:strand:+ start:346 stop:495 length:150 start_codon:yes stop_codon:yes gene_type:complete
MPRKPARIVYYRIEESDIYQQIYSKKHHEIANNQLAAPYLPPDCDGLTD